MTESRIPKILVPRARELELTRRLFLGGIVGAGATLALAACAPSGSGTSGGGAGAGTMRVYSWAGYDDPTNVKEFGKKVAIDSYSSNEEMIAKLVAARGTSGYDMVIPTGVFVPQMAENDLLEKLDLSRLKNIGNVDAAFMGQEWDPDNSYTVPKFWGTTGFAYDTRVITRDLVSWDDFIDAAQNEASGRTSLADDPGEICSILCFARGWNQSTQDKGELEQIRKFLVDDLAPHISAFDSAPGGGAIPQGSQALVHTWNGEARRGILASGDPDRWKWVLPTPETNLWTDNWAIVKGAKNIDAAYEFIDFSLGIEESARNTEFVGYGTGIGASQDELVARDVELLDMIFPSEEEKARMYTGQINAAQETRMAIVSEMKARAGA
ncbi:MULTISPECIES: spermidine/putrescine ABC transporter substrate-binding protein [unclassified Leucobacter]|uniref:polyamine ABC transporter substrate-binding protein n=1 Tax=unclassified Leucobacter TaxID=2621730 RepID=UPI00165E9BD3|nr:MULTISPECIES: spermidine/putrescine ABC transporter substrate-binding protein [unclassified Leucobacter]MBC9928568.1 spermidine/putrescine ABC transporter substrate-binding protein [Leucobacter sp. cx-169]MBC9936059.1 spermidine/putrescine ABC transporter substrate-binding protein [Leucobacter sp. cx-87]